MALKFQQFDGTIASAKTICAWLGEGVAAWAPHPWTDTKNGLDPATSTEAQQAAGLDLIEERDGAPFYVTVYPTDWVGRDGGAPQVFTDAQHSLIAGS